jgi:mxaK protein
MSNRVKYKNQLVGATLLISLVGSTYEAYQYNKINNINEALLTGKVIINDGYEFHKKFSNAYQQSKTGNYKHAVQGFGQILEANKSRQADVYEASDIVKSNVHYNIANNFLRLGLQRSVNADGTVHEETMYAFMQAKRAYQQALKLNPNLGVAKYNLSLLLSIMPEKMTTVAKDQSSMVISNLPQGLP